MKDLEKQSELTCKVCNGNLEYVKCGVEVFKTISGSTFIYEHKGFHTHPKPPEGKAHPKDYQKLRDIIINNPNTSPHALIIGSSLSTNDNVGGPGQSIGEIAPQFNNTSRVSKIRRQILSDESDLITSMKGSDAFLVDYTNFHKDYPNFIQQFTFEEDVAIISVQTNFMRQMLSVYRSDLVDQDELGVLEELPMIFDHGCVTDAAHKYFTNGKLLITCCYFEILHRWQPIFLSWIGRQTAKTYEHHFFKLFQSIGSSLKVNDEASVLSTVFQQIVGTVVDFSEAQRVGFQVAYAKFMTTTAVGVQCQISKWIDEMEGNKFSFLSYDEHYNLAGSLLKGCQYHWK